jgi:hypothetical protein
MEADAKRHGIPLEQYKSQHNAGKAYCVYHHSWHPTSHFDLSSKSRRRKKTCRGASSRGRVSDPYTQKTRTEHHAKKFGVWGGRKLVLGDTDVIAEESRRR